MELKDMILKKGDIITVENKGRQWSVDIIIDEPQTLVDRFLSEYNIISIKRPVKYETIYEAPKEILDQKEKEYLEAVCKPFKNNIVCIVKCGVLNSEWISVEYQVKDTIFNFTLPNFEKGKYYKGMELDKEYTLDELGLFKE